MLHRLIDVLMRVSTALGAKCECGDFEHIAILVHRVMSWQSRQFHTLEHVFGFLEGADPQTALAAVFHDLIYYQVDEGLSPEIDALLSPSLQREGEGLFVIDKPPQGDWELALCLALFGLSPGGRLDPNKGQNEFLSALAFLRLLGGHLPRPVLLEVVSCIEASIPFRLADAKGSSPSELLETRIRAYVGAGGCELDEAGIERALRRSVAFGNADVRDFAREDVGLFLSNTWKLLPESNAALRHKGAFSVREYRLALEKMLGFFLSLDPSCIYHSYRGFPDAVEMKRLAAAAKLNLSCASTYIKAKLLAVGLIEAIADLSGGDAPMALFMGDLPVDGEEMETIASHLPLVGTPAWIDPDNAVYRLLKDGRVDDSSFDLRNSPLALYLYNSLEPRHWARLSALTGDFFAGRASAESFLESLGETVLRETLAACAEMVPTRRKILGDWLAARGRRP
jgi:hypothetical protein